jgi:hypothetical protein
LVTSYFTILATNTIVLHFANIFFPKYMEFGTHELSYTFALFLSMGILALAGTFAIPFVRIYENMRSKMFGSKEWMGLYFLINTAGIWIIARFAFQLGFGISSWMVAVALGAVLDVAQGLAMMVLEKVRVK